MWGDGFVQSSVGVWRLDLGLLVIHSWVLGLGMVVIFIDLLPAPLRCWY